MIWVLPLHFYSHNISKLWGFRRFFYNISSRVEFDVYSQKQQQHSSLVHSYSRKLCEFDEHPQEMEKGAYEGITQAASPSCDFAEMLQSDLTPSSLPLLFDLWSSYPPESQQASLSARPQHKCPWSLILCDFSVHHRGQGLVMLQREKQGYSSASE